jgi:tetratricopeptide (TPR) repeat protein
MNHLQSPKTNAHQIAKQLLDDGRLNETKKILTELLEEDPSDYLALHMLGLLAKKTNQWALAIAFFSRAIDTNKIDFASYFERGLVNRKLADLPRSISDFSSALSINPVSFEALNNRGIALCQAGNSAQAIVDFSEALALKPNCSQTYFNRGLAQRIFGHTNAALDDYTRSIELDAKNYRALNNRAMLHRDLKNFDKAIQDLDQCLSVQPDFSEALWNKSLTLLLIGEHNLGWELYESRWSTPEFKSKVRNFSSPLWLGENSLKNKTILIHSEQGLGDTLQFSRYINLLRDLSCTVLLEVEKPLVTIMNSLLPKENIFEKGTQLPEFDYHCPMMSLPLAFKTIGITHIKNDPYLKPDASAVARWSTVLGKSNKTRIGLAWRGNPNHVKNNMRSIELKELIPQLSRRFDWISLEINPSDEEADLMQKCGFIRNFGQEIGDFLSTSALCKNLHAVVSVDTSIAHLAGSIGTRVHLLLPYIPDFRWQHSGRTTHWYPNMILHRQSEDRDWKPIINDVNNSLLTDCN